MNRFGLRGSLALLLILTTLIISNSHGQPLLSSQQDFRGITVLRAPFVERALDGKLVGFFVDMMDEIAALAGFNYTLDVVNVTEEQIRNDNVASTILNELQRKSARFPNTFAIASQLTTAINNGGNRQSRFPYDFTEPYLTSGISVLVQKSLAKQYDIHSVADLMDEKRYTAQTDNSPPTVQVSLGATQQMYRQLSKISDPTIEQIYRKVYWHAGSVVDSAEIGVNRTIHSPYMFIQKQLNNELVVDRNCDLTHFVVEPQNKQNHDTKMEYVIAVGRPAYQSPSLPKSVDLFNKAIRELKANGKLDQLKRKYWNQKCNGAREMLQHHVTLISSFVSVAISLFLLH